MKQYLLNFLLLTFVVLLQGCTTWFYGIEPIYPSFNMGFEGKVDSLMPTFKWKPYTANKQISDITYNFQIGRFPRPNIIYERNNILTTNHKINIKLEADTRYYWQVQANYTENGNKHVTRWNRWRGMIFFPPSFTEPGLHVFVTPDL